MTFLNRSLRWPFVYLAGAALVGLVVAAFQQWSPPTLLAWPLLVLLLPVLGSAMIGGPRTALCAAAVAVLAADWFLLPPGQGFKVPGALDFSAMVAFGVASALMALVSHARHHAAVAQARAAELSRALAAEARRRRALGEVTARTLAAGSTESVCRETASLAASALDCDHALVLELGNEGAPFSVVAAAGWNADAVDGLTIYTGIDTQAGYAVYAREPVAVGDGDSEARFTIPAVLRGYGIRSGLAARIGTAVRPFGVIAVYSTSPRRFTEEDGQLLASIAMALAGLYERKRLEAERAEFATRDVAQRASADLASRRAAFLAQTVTVLDSALEPEATLVSLARLAVPSLADCAIVDLVTDEGNIQRIDVVDIDPTRREATQAIRRIPPEMRGDGPFARAIRTGQPALLSNVAEHARNTTVPARFGISASDSRGLVRGAAPDSARGARPDARPADPWFPHGKSIRRRRPVARAGIGRPGGGRTRERTPVPRSAGRQPRQGRIPGHGVARAAHADQCRARLGGDAAHASRSIRRGRSTRARRSSAARAPRPSCWSSCSTCRASCRGSWTCGLRRCTSKRSSAPPSMRSVRRPTKSACGSSCRSTVAFRCIFGDPERLQQVVINVLSNAVKFSPDEGIVEVELCRDETAARIIVSDQGVGIRSEFLPYVFDRLRQGATPAIEGLDWGSGSCATSSSATAGRVTAASDGEGKGSTFTVTLPLRAQVEPLPGGVRLAVSKSA